MQRSRLTFDRRWVGFLVHRFDLQCFTMLSQSVQEECVCGWNRLCGVIANVMVGDVTNAKDAVRLGERQIR